MYDAFDCIPMFEFAPESDAFNQPFKTHLRLTYIQHAGSHSFPLQHFETEKAFFHANYRLVGKQTDTH